MLKYMWGESYLPKWGMNLFAKGIDIGIYTTNFENEFISLTDIAKY